MVSKSLVFFLPVYATQVYGLTWDIFLLPMGWETYGGKFKYLTFINMVGHYDFLSQIYLCTAVAYMHIICYLRLIIDQKFYGK